MPKPIRRDFQRWTSQGYENLNPNRHAFNEDSMSNFDYIKAVNFDRAWLNFELDLPLETGADGCQNPFYITRPGDPIAELGDALLAPFYRPPKFFFSGHRGCGK